MPGTAPPGRVEADQRYRGGNGAREGLGLRIGRAISCTRFAAPPLISPPVKFGFDRVRSSGLILWRARMQSRKPGANRSICDSILFDMSTLQSNGTWQYAQSVC